MQERERRFLHRKILQQSTVTRGRIMILREEWTDDVLLLQRLQQALCLVL